MICDALHNILCVLSAVSVCGDAYFFCSKYAVQYLDITSHVQN